MGYIVFIFPPAGDWVGLSNAEPVVASSAGTMMAAPRKITNAEVLAAIQKWEWNVSATAEELGVDPKSIRKRLEKLGINLAKMRGAVDKGARRPTEPSKALGPLTAPGPSRHPGPSGTVGPSVVQGKVGNMGPIGEGGTFRGLRGGGEKKESDHFPRPAPTPKFVTVASATGTVEEVRLPKNPRIQPAHLKKLRAAKWRLSPQLERDLTETDVLEMFFDDCFDAWLERVTMPPPSGEPER